MLVLLFEPEIPPNTGNVARMCAAFGLDLHLVEPLGFSLDDRHLKRAGLDYWPHVRLSVWPDIGAFLERPGRPRDERLVLASTKASQPLQGFRFSAGDALVFGPETRGLPAEVFALSPHRVRIPCRDMEHGGVRSLNLSTACGIVCYAALAGCGLLPA